jgi:orotate phosphoribosyltransferase
VQALAAIGAAASGTEGAALESAAALYERGELTGPLAGLADRPARVIVLDDAITGIHAVRAAVERLREAGLDVMSEGIGVSPQADKRAALVQIAGRVVDDVNEGLALILD